LVEGKPGLKMGIPEEKPQDLERAFCESITAF
jgi:hypothetical protein